VKTPVQDYRSMEETFYTGMEIIEVLDTKKSGCICQKPLINIVKCVPKVQGGPALRCHPHDPLVRIVWMECSGAMRSGYGNCRRKKENQISQAPNTENSRGSESLAPSPRPHRINLH